MSSSWDGQPGAPLPDKEGHSSRGRLERVLRAGTFAVTAELAPPDSALAEDVYERARVFDGWVDGMNATDGSGANCHMSSVAMCALLTTVGYSPVLQISCRDKNRIAIQGDVLGAAAMGVSNILCLSGDGVQVGDHPEAKPVFDLDSMSLLETIRIMRDESRFLSGRQITSPPQVFLGAAENPSAPPVDFRPYRLAKKIAAGAQFIQTQYVYDVEELRVFMAKCRDLGLLERCYVLPGVGPLASARTVDPQQRARHSHPGRNHQAPRRRREPETGRAANLRRADPADPRNRRRQRRSHHGLPPGRSRS